jgi:hypothetical protein
MTYDDMVEGLYDLTCEELRALALECLLITDGPDKVNCDEQRSEHNIVFTVHDDSGAVQETLWSRTKGEMNAFVAQLPEGWYIEILNEEE